MPDARTISIQLYSGCGGGCVAAAGRCGCCMVDNISFVNLAMVGILCVFFFATVIGLE